MACFLLSAVETSAIERMFSSKHGYRLDATQEFLAIGAANLVAGLGSGFPVSGGSSQSLVNESAGARSPLSGVIAALITLFVALFLTGLLHDLPQPVLAAAIVLVAITGLIDVHKLREIWRFSREEFVIAAAAFLGVLGSGLLNGVLIGVALSIGLLIRRAARPRVVEVGRVPATYLSELVRHPENERVPGALVDWPEGAILYFNADHVSDHLAALVAARDTPPQVVILFMGSVPFVDIGRCGTSRETSSYKFGRQGILLRLAEVHGEVACGAPARRGR